MFESTIIMSSFGSSSSVGCWIGCFIRKLFSSQNGSISKKISNKNVIVDISNNIFLGHMPANQVLNLTVHRSSKFIRSEFEDKFCGRNTLKTS